MTSGEFLCWQLNKLFPKKTIGANLSALAYSEMEYAWAKESAAALLARVDLRDKVILDAGCGLGGRSAFYAESGSTTVTGIDLDENHVRHSREFAAHKGISNIQFEIESLADLSFEADRFDVIILNDVVEHIARPILIDALRELKRVLKPGGKIFIEFPPWSSHDAGHLYDYIHIPWSHLLFSGETLINVVKRMNPGPRFGKSSYIEHFEELNRITIEDFDEMIRDLDFKVVSLERRMIRNKKVLEHLPLISRYATTRVIAVLSK